jgi:type VI secretion system secreted protein Hcp
MTTKLSLNPQLARMLVAGVFAAAVAAPAAAADDIFLKLDGIRGESMDARHKDEIEILSYTQTFSGPFAKSGTPSTAAAAGKTTCGPVTIMKYIDVSSPDLILNAANGRHIPTAVFTFRRPGKELVEYYKVILEDVIVVEVEQSDTKLNFPNPAPPRAIEKVSLIGRRFRFEYTATTNTGGTGAKPKAGWDCVSAGKI